MTDTAGPFDGAPWAEAQWARFAALWAPSAVYGPPGTSTSTGELPLSISGLSVGLGAGRAWVRGFGFERSGGAVMQTVAANTHASFSRRDRIVMRRNLATHTVAPVLIQGTAASSPAAPALTQVDAGSWDLPMFSFLVPPNSGTAISGVLDERLYVDPATGDLAVVASNLSLMPNYASGAVTWGAPKVLQQGAKMRLQGSVTNSAAGTPFNATAGTEYQIATLPTRPDGSSAAPADTRAYPVAYGNGTTFAAGLIVVYPDGRVNFLSSTNANISSVGFLSLSLSGIDWIAGL